MKLNQVLFIGGRHTLASVQVRCVDIAQKLGCDYILDAINFRDIPDKYSAFVCIKPDLALEAIGRLSKRGKIVWDIIDGAAPRDYVSCYIASTKITKELFFSYGKVKIIPHHHCNFTGTPNSPGLRQLTWIGSRHWEPKLPGFSYKVFHVNNMRQADIIAAHRQTGIGLNFRNRIDFAEKAYPKLLLSLKNAKERGKLKRKLFQFHLAVNSGIKLINCLGFGTPSVSDNEPAYYEIDRDCTIFSRPGQCAQKVATLKEDRDLYAFLRKNCLREASRYHLDAIAEKYKKLIADL